MALPKRRHSSSRQGKRRGQIKIVSGINSVCPQCQALKPSHSVCTSCGYYKGQKILLTAEERKDIKDKRKKKRLARRLS